MELEYEFTLNDYADLTAYLYKKNGIKILILVLLLLFILSWSSGSDVSSTIGYLIGYALVIVLAWFFTPVITKFAVQSLLSKYFKKGLLLGKKKITLTHEELILETEYSKNIYLWKGINSIESDKKLILIFSERILCVPKRCFKDENDINLFLSYVQERIKESGRDIGYVKENPKIKERNKE